MVHHLLIGLGLNPRQAALLLYCFSGFLCGAVLLGVALKNEVLALILGISGCLAFLLIVTSRLDELSSLRGDLRARMARGRQERFAARITWEAIQRIELCEGMEARSAWILEETTQKLGCELIEISCSRARAPGVPARRRDPGMRRHRPFAMCSVGAGFPPLEWLRPALDGIASSVTKRHDRRRYRLPFSAAAG